MRVPFIQGLCSRSEHPSDQVIHLFVEPDYDWELYQADREEEHNREACTDFGQGICESAFRQQIEHWLQQKAEDTRINHACEAVELLAEELVCKTKIG